MLFLQTSIVRKPLCPTFVHDEPTRVAICLVGIVVCSYLICRIMRHYGV